MAAAPPLLEVTSLAIRRSERLLFRDLNLRLHPGETLHLQGANGSGKTTLLRFLAGLGHAEAGQVRWHCPPAHRFIYLGHSNAHKPLLSAYENLLLPACGEPVSRAQAQRALQEAQLAALARRQTASLSAGQQRRLALARLLLRPARLWLLDEPFAALDTDAKVFWQQQCRDFCAGGGAVLLTGHDYALSEARQQQLNHA